MTIEEVMGQIGMPCQTAMMQITHIMIVAKSISNHDNVVNCGALLDDRNLVF